MERDKYPGVGSNPTRREHDPDTLAGDQTQLPDDVSLHGSTGAGRSGDEGLREKADQAKEKAGQVQEKAGEMAGQAQEKADEGMQKAAEGLDRAASTLREKMDSQGGAVGSAATSAAGALEQGAEMLRSTDTDQLLNDVESMVRRRPVESMLVAAGVGFVLSKAIR